MLASPEDWREAAAVMRRREQGADGPGEPLQQRRDVSRRTNLDLAPKVKLLVRTQGKRARAAGGDAGRPMVRQRKESQQPRVLFVLLRRMYLETIFM